MGLLSLVTGFCAGFYFRNTIYGSHLSNKLFAAYKILQTKNDTQYKLVLVVREDLKMGQGKIASQCSHASVLAYQNVTCNDPEAAKLWEAYSQQKVVLKVSSEQALLKLQETAKLCGVLTSIVQDAGRTQVTYGTKTVLAIGPGPIHRIDEITGHLKLL